MKKQRTPRPVHCRDIPYPPGMFNPRVRHCWITGPYIANESPANQRNERARR